MHRRHCLALAAAAALQPATRAFAAGARARFDAALGAFPDFNGTVLAGRGGQVLFSRALGLADLDQRVPMRLETRFETGSVSKWIAAMVVLKLVDLGKLALDAAILDYLPDYRADTGARLTLRHLLSHASGVPNEIAAARKADPQIAFVELDQMEAVRRYASGDLRFAPGSAWDYSHANWLIVKAIVERASGRAYRDCVAAWLVQPLGLRDSGIFHGESSAVPGMAVAYAGMAPPWQRRVSAVPAYLAMAGGFYSSAPDMLRLMDGVLGGDILAPASRATLMRVVMPEQHYALGGRTRVETIAGKAREAAWEDGANGGFRLVARRVLDDGMSVVVFNNGSDDHRRLGELASALMEAAYG
ncbi:serine hydrolase [uncultured Massilia sp.]|uniref:serine hydrolase domain-containing protein n=1 Tax=uncultured Massilia sp. TaxID=169973 RepID=UPI0025D7DAFF|nr:serine hydrolase domain-containing protein [uncultured Massilia sp.]